MKQLIGSSFVVAALTVVSSFACTQPVDESTGVNQDKIVGGVEATPNEYAGAVALYMGSQQVCGGTLVADEWVVSAGHCVVRPTAVNGGITSIVIGRHKLTDATTGEQINVKKAFRHEGYNSSTLVNDISLFQLEHKSTAPLAKLVTADQALASVTAEAVTTVVGWGTTREGGRPSDVLLKVDVPIIANDICKAFPRYNNVAEGMICAGFREGGKDSCQGDSGGPLFMKINGEFRHVGLTSWGIGCARASAPGVYTRTSMYLDWLKTTSGGAITEATPVPPTPSEPTPSEPTPAGSKEPSAH
jgi:secreted trypsin-like serine protease